MFCNVYLFSQLCMKLIECCASVSVLGLNAYLGGYNVGICFE